VKRACALLFLPGMLPLLAVGADYEKCAIIVPDAQRLACYDQVAGQDVAPSPAFAEPGRVIAQPRPDDVAVAGSLLGKNWELDERSLKRNLPF